MNQSEIKKIVVSVVMQYLISQQIDHHIDESTSLFGDSSILDSMGLVNIVIDLESEFLDKNIEISLTSEKAMSRRQSPFRTIATLVDFISEQIDAK